MSSTATPSPSPRRHELLEAAYQYALTHGLADLSLRPLASAIGSSPRVLLYLFGSKDGLIRALLERARADELEMVSALDTGDGDTVGIATMTRRVWQWLAASEHRALLTLWVEAYARSLRGGSDGPWADFAHDTVGDWLAILAAGQAAETRHTAAAIHARTATLAVLRGALLDLLATGDIDRTTAAIDSYLAGETS